MIFKVDLIDYHSRTFKSIQVKLIIVTGHFYDIDMNPGLFGRQYHSQKGGPPVNKRPSTRTTSSKRGRPASSEISRTSSRTNSASISSEPKEDVRDSIVEDDHKNGLEKNEKTHEVAKVRKS